MMTHSFEFDKAIFINLTTGRDSLEQFIHARFTVTPELRVMEWYALRVLFTHNEPLTLTTLSELFGKKPNSFEYIVKKLKKYGYIVPQKHTIDYRKSVLKLSDKAIAIRDDFLAQAKAIDDQISAYLAEQFNPLLQKLRLLQQLSA